MPPTGAARPRAPAGGSSGRPTCIPKVTAKAALPQERLPTRRSASYRVISWSVLSQAATRPPAAGRGALNPPGGKTDLRSAPLGLGAGGVGHSRLRGGTVADLLSGRVMPPAHSNSLPPLLLCTQKHYMSGTPQSLPACQTSQSRNATCGLYLFLEFTRWFPTQVTQLPKPPLSHL